MSLLGQDSAHHADRAPGSFRTSTTPTQFTPRTYSNMKAGPKYERAEYSCYRQRCRSRL